MNNFFEGQIEIIEDFNKKVHIAQNKAIFTRKLEIQELELDFLDKYTKQLNEKKLKYILEKRENEANFILLLMFSVKVIQQELHMLINLKSGNMADAWDALVTAQKLTEVVIRNHPSDGSYLSGYLERLHCYEITLFPKMMFGSIGGIVEDSECSICNNAYDKCSHIKGYFYMGEMCYRIINKIDLEEVSTVENPADKRCRVMYITDARGDRLDLLTLEKKSL